MATFQTPFAPATPITALQPVARNDAPPLPRLADLATEGPKKLSGESQQSPVVGSSPILPQAFANPVDWQAPPLPDESAGFGWSEPLNAERRIDGREVSSAVAGVTPRAAAGHAMLLAAAFSHLEMPPYLQALLAGTGANRADASPASPGAAPFVVAPEQSRTRPRRWSMDGWVLWRDDTTTPLLTGRPSYGRSQAGAVARYELVPSSGHRPQAHLRASTALEGGRDREAALGMSARPLHQVPIRFAAEGRLSATDAGTEVRPAAYAVTELAPLDLPAGLRGEVYLQAGYVGGTFATPFVDGQARIDRDVTSAADFDLRAGAGAWGGAQEDGARLDIGPSASVTFELGDARGRLAADYRVRVAGNAEPSSGPALTLSAGF